MTVKLNSVLSSHKKNLFRTADPTFSGFVDGGGSSEGGEGMVPCKQQARSKPNPSGAACACLPLA